MKSTIKEGLTWMLIDNLKLSCMVGIKDWEKHIPQNLYLDIAFGYQRPASHKDDIGRVTDYAHIAACVSKYCASRKFHLLESWMDGISLHIFSAFPTCLELKLSLSKPCALENADRVTLSCRYYRDSKTNRQPVPIEN